MSVRAPVFLLLAATLAAAPRPPFEYLLAPTGPGNPRNSEADILELRRGRLLVAWTEFHAEKNSDWASAVIAARISKDRGRTWGAPYVLQENTGRMNVMEPDLLRLASGHILFLFVEKNSPADCRPMMRLSRDDGRTFSAPRAIPVDPAPSYTFFNHDRAIQLRSGRILAPFCYTLDYRVDPRIRSRVYYSDDEGAQWRPSRTVVDVAASKVGAQEPGVVELRDGRVMMWLRNSTGKVYRAISADHGESWSAPEPMRVTAPVSPQSIKRIPSTGHLLMVWNNSPDRRFPLSTAISENEGETWSHVKDLDADPAHTYAYTSITFVKDRVRFTYYAGPPAGTRGPATWALKLKSVPVAWLYK